MYLSAIKLAALAVLLFPMIAKGDEAVLLRSPETVITVDDIDRYIIENIPSTEPQRTAVLSKPTIYLEMAESLLTIRTLAREAESSLSMFGVCAMPPYKASVSALTVSKLMIRMLGPHLGVSPTSCISTCAWKA